MTPDGRFDSQTSVWLDTAGAEGWSGLQGG